MERLINNISELLQQELGLTEERKEVAAYGLYVFISSITGIVSIVVVGFLLGILKLALVAVLTASGLRVLSGGAHSANLRNCTLLGMIVSPGIAMLAEKLGHKIPTVSMYSLVFVVGLFALWAIITYAPADTPNKPIISEDYRRRLRNLALVYLSIWAVVIIFNISGTLFSPAYDLVLASTLGILWQAFSLTPGGYKLVAFIDGILP